MDYKNKVWSCMPQMASKSRNIIYHKHMILLNRRVSLGKDRLGNVIWLQVLRLWQENFASSIGEQLSWVRADSIFSINGSLLWCPMIFIKQFPLFCCGIIGNQQTEQGNVLYIHELVDSGEYFRMRNEVYQRTKLLPPELRNRSCGFFRLPTILRTQIR